ncbi:hypothetical protein [Pseudoalteromonas luteoviolacea]|uniref:Phytanoyl-CoA dioxygenase n=1 Tax=Pseudoalteromonas luteoviolacea NCIMB 1942 TaxID=1365253 RepID=A0A167HPF7_9GAMM|nr:hypothetical protein [Pseudoalteromonas luteoviolacea]KZN58356.1 hypothetical protein N482_22490 [Pseudoalteromonas luteoviolacea NCIMB 1942]KZW98503.1 hypothetical protein JL49_22940 [Pseudoalteromonas luteoviolacea]
MTSLNKREMSLRTMYQHHGLLRFQNMYSQATLTKWNRVLDPVFERLSSKARSYVRPDELVKLGILKEVMCNRLLNVISILDPCPILLHCHCFEIGGNCHENLFDFSGLDGWHREPSDPSIRSVRGCRPCSIYIYLTDVAHSDFGSFEIVPGYEEGLLKSNMKSCNITGNKGTCFLWNPDLYHRPNANRSPLKQRILKISIQTNGWANASIQLSEFKNALTILGDDDPALAYLLGSHFGNNQAIKTMPYTRTGDLPRIKPLDCSEKTQVPTKAETMLRRIKYKLDKALGI